MNECLYFLQIGPKILKTSILCNYITNSNRIQTNTLSHTHKLTCTYTYYRNISPNIYKLSTVRYWLDYYHTWLRISFSLYKYFENSITVKCHVISSTSLFLAPRKNASMSCSSIISILTYVSTSR